VRVTASAAGLSTGMEAGQTTGQADARKSARYGRSTFDMLLHRIERMGGSQPHNFLGRRGTGSRQIMHGIRSFLAPRARSQPT
jgi:hypothetical protein